MKFAFLIMGDFNCNIDRAIIHDGMAQIVGVANIEDACMVAKKLKRKELIVLNYAVLLVKLEQK